MVYYLPSLQIEDVLVINSMLFCFILYRFYIIMNVNGFFSYWNKKIQYFSLVSKVEGVLS